MQSAHWYIGLKVSTLTARHSASPVRVRHLLASWHGIARGCGGLGCGRKPAAILCSGSRGTYGLGLQHGSSDGSASMVEHRGCAGHNNGLSLRRHERSSVFGLCHSPTPVGVDAAGRPLARKKRTSPLTQPAGRRSSEVPSATLNLGTIRTCHPALRAISSMDRPVPRLLAWASCGSHIVA
jgi:hypothetical protein